MPSPLVRTFHHDDFRIDDLVEAKRGRRVSVVLPARNEAPTIGPIVSAIRKHLVRRRGLPAGLTRPPVASLTPDEALALDRRVAAFEDLGPWLEPVGAAGRR